MHCRGRTARWNVLGVACMGRWIHYEYEYIRHVKTARTGRYGKYIPTSMYTLLMDS